MALISHKHILKRSKHLDSFKYKIPSHCTNKLLHAFVTTFKE